MSKKKSRRDQSPEARVARAEAKRKAYEEMPRVRKVSTTPTDMVKVLSALGLPDWETAKGMIGRMR